MFFMMNEAACDLIEDNTTLLQNTFNLKLAMFREMFFKPNPLPKDSVAVV